MNDVFIDRIARAFATSASRRVLVGAAAGFAGLRQGWAAAGPERGRRCSGFCAATFPAGPEREQCAARAARGAGLCVEGCENANICDPVSSPNNGCGGSALCFCATTIEGAGLCLDGELLARLGHACDEARCESSDACGGGEACIRLAPGFYCESGPDGEGGCGPGVCVPLAAGCRGLKRETSGTGTVRVRWR